MHPASVSGERVGLDGKFFRLGGERFTVKGITYGPFAPGGAEGAFPAGAEARRDFELIRELGANVLRVYHEPAVDWLDEAGQAGLKVWIDVPWGVKQCFLDDPQQQRRIRQTIRETARRCARHPAVFALSVANEIPPDIVRWSGVRKMESFLDRMVAEVKEIDDDCLCTFGNFPPTEYLRPREIDFVSFNVYLHDPRPFESYLARLQMLADTRPLVLGEMGIDSIRQGEAAQSQRLHWQIESAFRLGCAGTVVFSFTDDWFTDGCAIENWAFGLTTRARERKPAFEAVRRQYGRAPLFPLPETPRVSVVVACYNGARTLRPCLESLQHLDYPDYDVIVVDDGSTDASAAIAGEFAGVRRIRHESNRGLSAARNTGIAAATGEVVAFTDADCRADRAWLHYLVGDLVRGRFAGAGGHNLLPPDDSCVGAAVMVSPGGPAHVMLNDRQAEHVPGCNMAFLKWALAAIEGFDPDFRQAGDDVDLCWRLQQAGLRIGFSPGAFVWHYRRPTVGAYLRQQQGYGEAEAMLVRKHPEYFGWLGGGIWRGRIYSPAKYGLMFQRPRIYHGRFATGFYQLVYAAPPGTSAMGLTALEYHALATVPLTVLTLSFSLLLPAAIVAWALPVCVCVVAAAQAEVPRKKRRFWTRPLVAGLYFLQPLARGWARYRGQLGLHPASLAARENLDSLTWESRGICCSRLDFWSEGRAGRPAFLEAFVRRLDRAGWASKTDSGWNDYDVEITGSLWTRLQVATAAEVYPRGGQLIRCRLRPRWTYLSWLLFAAGLGLILLLIALWGQAEWRHWLLLAALGPVAAWFHRQGQCLRRLVAALLDECARALGLERMDRIAGLDKKPCPDGGPPAAPTQ